MGSMWVCVVIMPQQYITMLVKSYLKQKFIFVIMLEYAPKTNTLHDDVHSEK